MTDLDPLELAGWKLATGSLRSEELPALATDALVRGLDSPSLRELAGQDPGDVRDSRDLFIRALDELSIATIDPPTSMDWLIRSTAGAVVDGTISAWEGAQWLSMAAHKIDDEGDLRIFIGLSSYLEDHPDEFEAVEPEIVKAASDLLQRPALTRWIRLSASTTRSPLTRFQGTIGRTVDVQPEDLSISPALIAEISNWNSAFVHLMTTWPRGGGFDSELQATAFVTQGKAIATTMQHELGTSYHIDYRPEPTEPPGVKIATGFAGKIRRRLVRMKRLS